MDAQAAARSGDEIAHGVGMAAMIGGALLGALAGAALVVATAATGGVAAVIVAGAVAGGGLSVGSLVKGLATICNLPEPSSGVLMAGSLNVWVNSRPAQRASLDRAAVCSGFPMNHYSLPMPLVAEGSASVFINGCPAARLSSKLICGAHIKSASPNVTWGGPTVRTDAVFDREEWLRTGLQGLGVLALVGGCLVGSFAGAVITAGAFVIGSVVFGALRQWGDSLGPGYADLFEGVAGIALLAGGARAAARAKMPAVAEGEGGGAKEGITVAEDAAAIRANVLRNIAKSQAARASSQFEQLSSYETAYKFYANAGFSADRSAGHLAGIAFTQPVTLTELTPGTNYLQYPMNGKMGNYFTTVGTPAETIGINPAGRVPTLYTPTTAVTALRSTAADIIDTWTVPSQPYMTKGGGIQYFVPDKSVFAQVPNP